MGVLSEFEGKIRNWYRHFSTPPTLVADWWIQRRKLVYVRLSLCLQLQQTCPGQSEDNQWGLSYERGRAARHMIQTPRLCVCVKLANSVGFCR